jgi:hypothetical protein
MSDTTSGGCARSTDEFAWSTIEESEPILDRFWYGLSFKQGERKITCFGIDGEDIPNAADIGGRPSIGNWSGELDAGEDVFERVIGWVVEEAIHEALEWLRLDGEVLLDPHGVYKPEIWTASQAAVRPIVAAARLAYAERMDSASPEAGR